MSREISLVITSWYTLTTSTSVPQLPGASSIRILLELYDTFIFLLLILFPPSSFISKEARHGTALLFEMKELLDGPPFGTKSYSHRHTLSSRSETTSTTYCHQAPCVRHKVFFLIEK